jgi:hypothetical protein
VNVGLAFEQAEVLTVMAELDVPGGFQLGTPENAASARRWAWIGLALATLDVAWLDGNAAAQLRGAAVGMTVITPLAEALHGDGE